jgi:hypothetical protein
MIMWVVFWTYYDARGVLSDAYEVAQYEGQAMARARQLAERESVYAWGVALIAHASEPHWKGGAL